MPTLHCSVLTQVVDLLGVDPSGELQHLFNLGTCLAQCRTLLLQLSHFLLVTYTFFLVALQICKRLRIVEKWPLIRQ
jgi:hypothetical protein